MSRPIAYLTGEYPRATDTFIQREVAALRACGLVVETCSIRRTGPEHLVGEEQCREAGSTFYTLAAAAHPLRLMSAHLGGFLHAPGRYFRALGLALQTNPGGIKALIYQLVYFAEAGVLAAHLRQIKARHLHNHIASAAGSVAMLAAEMAGIPFSFTLHGPDIFYEPHRWRLDLKIRRAAFVVCISNYARAQAMNLSQRPDWGKLKIVHCGVDPGRYGRTKTAGQRLLFVGRLAAVKGVPLLLEALVRLRATNPKVHLTLIGDGPERAGLEAETMRLGLSDAVTFAGYKSQDEVAGALRETDIFVLPSFAEGVPVVLMEAMAAGLPVIATAVGGVGELVRDGQSGRITPPGDVDALTQAISDILADPKKGMEMGKIGAKTVAAEFDSQIEAAKLAALLSEGQQ